MFLEIAEEAIAICMQVVLYEASQGHANIVSIL